MMTIKKLTLCSLLTLVLYPVLAAGIEMKHPNTDRGYVQGSMYAFDKPDSINLFNGALSVSLPLGRRYPLSETFSYGLSLTYSSQVWDNIFVENPNTPPPPFVTESLPSRLSNVGLGWSLSFGMLFPPGVPNFNPTINWLFVAQDGSQHYFYRTLHYGDYLGAEPPEESDVYYTRDGAYLRMVIENQNRAIIQQPDGIEYVLEPPENPNDGTGFGDWRTVQIRDRFSDGVETNVIDISYDYDSNLCAPEIAVCERWRIDDSLGRTHVLEFDRVAGFLGSGGTVYTTYLRSVRLEAFDDLSPSEYVFSYSTKIIPRGSLDNHPDTGYNVYVTFLDQIDFPDEAAVGGVTVNSRFQFVYNEDQCGGSCEAGTLARLAQPTGGVNTWDYGHYNFPGGNLICNAIPHDQVPYWTQLNAALSENHGVVQRTVSRPGNGSGNLVWTYEPQAGVVPGTPVVSRTVTDPDGNDTVHYFQTNVVRCHDNPQNPSVWSGWDYGLPFGETVDPATGAYLSREYYQGSKGQGELKKRDFVTYAHDELPPLNGSTDPTEDAAIVQQPRWWYDTNRRPTKTLTQYLSGSQVSQTLTTSHSDFDGLGHYRTSYTRADLGSGFCRPGVNSDCITQRKTTTTFNPDNHKYEVHPNLNTVNVVDPYIEWYANAPWILGTSESTRTVITRGNTQTDTSTTETVFDSSTGRLRRARTYANGQTRGGHDLITTYGYDAYGNRTLVARYGADRQEVPLGDLEGLSLGLPDSTNRTEFDSGVAARSYPLAIGDPTAPDPPMSLNRDVDQWTGLTIRERDISGFETTFAYDQMGRIKTVTPEDVRAARFELEYFPARMSGDLTTGPLPTILNKAETVMRAYDQNTNAIVSVNKARYDGFGRAYRQRVRMPNDDQGNLQWAKKTVHYDGRGRLIQTSQWVPDILSDESDIWTVNDLHDYQGRVGRITRPDNSVTTFTYDGMRHSERTLHDVPVADSPQPIDITVMTEKDGFGHVRKITEPIDGASTVATTSVFDVLGNLTEVRVKPSDTGITQTRAYEYDHLGFLRTETIPEKTYDQPWDVQWSHFNTRGQAGMVDDAGRNFLNVHDAFGRLTEIWERKWDELENESRRLLKKFDYYDSDEVASGYDSTYGWALHKVQRTSHWNYYSDDNPNEATVYAELPRYKGVGGAIDLRSNEMWGPIVGFPELPYELKEAFETGFSYTNLGQIETVAYPQVTYSHLHDQANPIQWVGGADFAPPDRTLQYDYEQGWLVGVADGADQWVQEIDFWPSGLVKKITHRNGVEEHWLIDESTFMARPVEIHTSKIIPVEDNWSQTMSYDPAGNIVTMGDITNAYDRLGRLVDSYSAVSGFGEALTYDGFGNMTGRVEFGTGNPAPDLTIDPTTNRLLVSQGFRYDDAGNLVDTNFEGANPDFDIKMVYTPFDKQIRIFSPQQEPYDILTYNFFNSDGERLAEYDALDDRWIYILRDHKGQPLRRIEINGADPWFWEKDYIRMPGRLLAAAVHGTSVPPTRTSVLLKRSFHTDHLGTPRSTTGDGGYEITREAYLPFGFQVSTPGVGDTYERAKFTGHTRDFFLGPATKYDLDYMHARRYSPYLGRFLSVDPVSGVGGGSQRMNGYAYVLNNPLTYVDPDGRTVVVADDVRLKAAVAAWRSTKAGAIAFSVLDKASGVYQFNRIDKPLTSVERQRLKWGQSVKRNAGHFNPKYQIKNGSLDWVSGGSVNVDFSVVDNAKGPPYNTDNGDAAIVAHEGGHGVHYEEERGEMVALDYDEQEEVADEHRDAVVAELEQDNEGQ